MSRGWLVLPSRMRHETKSLVTPTTFRERSAREGGAVFKMSIVAHRPGRSSFGYINRPTNNALAVRQRTHPLRAAAIAAAGTAGEMARRFMRRGRRARASRFNARRGFRTKRRNVTSGQGITDQYDRSNIYVKRRMPRGKRRSWKKWTRKVHAVAEKDLGSRTWLRNGVANLFGANPAANIQTVGEIALYPCRGQTTIDEDLTTLVAEDTTIPTAGRIIFQSAVLDLTIVNRSTVEGGGGIPVELDVYVITARKSFQSNAVGRDLLGAFTDGFNDTTNIGGAGTGISITRRGVTPFEATQALSKYGMKIWKKTKYTIGSTQSITYQMRDPKRHVYEKAFIEDNSLSANIKGTKFLFFVARLQPGYASGAGTQLDVDIGYTKKYMYKVDESNGDQSRVN